MCFQDDFQHTGLVDEGGHPYGHAQKEESLYYPKMVEISKVMFITVKYCSKIKA
jgi:hypothetical protein